MCLWTVFHKAHLHPMIVDKINFQSTEARLFVIEEQAASIDVANPLNDMPVLSHRPHTTGLCDAPSYPGRAGLRR